MTNVSETIQPHPAVRAQFEIRRIAIVAIMAVGLGFVMQALILSARLLAGGGLPQVGAVADLAQSVTWSVFVCSGVAVGIAVGKARHVLAGLIAVLFTPVSIAVAKASQKAMLAVAGALEKPDILPLVTLGTIRALEYGVLAWALAVLAEKQVTRASTYLGVGVAVGAVFGSALVYLSVQAAGSAAPLALPQIAGIAVNEIGSPIGCALLIFLGQLVARNLAIFNAHQPAKPAE